MRTTLFALMLFVLFPQGSWAQGSTNLTVGEAKTFSIRGEVTSVFISGKNVADYQVIDSHKVVVFGRTMGSASFIAFDSQGNEILNRLLVVNKSYRVIEQQIEVMFPNAQVSVAGIGDNVVLSGLVANEQEKDNIHQLVGELLGKTATSTSYQMSDEESDDVDVGFMTQLNYQGVVNNVEISATKQVNVKLTIAEVSHSFMQDFGIKMGSNGNPGIFVDQLTHFSASDIVSVISALGTDSVGQVLAEPNLSVISGEKASFLVGGELPVVTVIDGGTNVEYKEFGVRLELLAKVLRDDKIKLALTPEVSSLDGSYSSDNFDLPALRTRRAQTTVELGDGQSFVLGGLLNSEEKESLTRIPYIGDIPIIGALFRHTGTERSKTELVIVATVNLVQPLKAEQIQLPTMKKTSTLKRFFGLGSEYEQSQQKWADEILSSGGFSQ
ncbi:pilus assembly protein N-terminal domain-containing protein [uncultured Vibrio sp.]|uniref:type II and III secretion system protein family protein n=1 Tax=uncultured Vibrio sp. TaxID=114054 RepID=UPI0009194006|nr:pilus assembly protein N-terminal domain-containing protein [uncultured Vibrio sp.]OIQ25105.1 MAG: general secretion pathway protein GspD [Vibrio sp. MedPE-SWchi]